MGVEKAMQDSRDYFDAKIERYGPTPEGADYNSAQAQAARFAQLVKIIDASRRFSLLDYGCGWGALLDYLAQRGWKFEYFGFDRLSSMIEAGRRTHREFSYARFSTEAADLPVCDYAIAGAMMNNKFGAPDPDWQEYTLEVLDAVNAHSSIGFAFNFLSRYSDPTRMAQRPDLYFADPCFYFDHCKRHYADNIALLHDYVLNDFTILVRKQV
jgi:SAM-dependent methyltransferase